MNTSRKVPQALFCCLLLIIVQGALYATTTKVGITVADRYTDVPLESAWVGIIHQGVVLDSAFTDAEGFAELQYTITGVDDIPALPDAFEISQNYPNPFVSSTSIDLAVGTQQTMYFSVLNVSGQRVASHQQVLTPGNYQVDLSLGHVVPGIYFLHVYGHLGTFQTVELVKTGARYGQPGRLIEIHSGAGGKTFPGWADAGSGSAGEKPRGAPLPVFGADEASSWAAGSSTRTGGDLFVRAFKDRYGVLETDIVAGQDTTMQIGLQRYNEVILLTEDQDGEPFPLELLVSGLFYNMEITSPDTLIMPSGMYTVSSDKGFIVPFEYQVEVASVDMYVLIIVERVSSFEWTILDDENELLFVIDNEDGTSSYFFGLRGENEENGNQEKRPGNKELASGMDVTHVTIEFPDGSLSTIIFNEEIYPISWTAPGVSISLRRQPGDEAFDPEQAPHSFFFEGQEDTLTLNIRPGNLYDLLDWFEADVDVAFDDVRWFLDHYSSDFDEIQAQAGQSGPDQQVYFRAAAAFTTLAAVHAFDVAGIEKTNTFRLFSAYDIIPERRVLKSATYAAKEAAKAMLGCGLGSVLGWLTVDRTGPTTPVFICRGATMWPHVCQNSVHMGLVSDCLSVCPVTLECFADICIPDVMNIQQALSVRANN